MEGEKLIDRLSREQTLEDSEFELLLSTGDASLAEALRLAARRVAVENHGRVVKSRGLIEVSNICRNNCYYCGIRAANRDVARYRLSKEEILDCCSAGAELGFQTFVLQGGEDGAHSAEWVEDVVREIRARYPGHAITLSLGERPDEDYRRWFDAGADRYLLRHETATRSHYYRLHPEEMSFENRLRCIRTLKRIGYETGVGMMVGSPGQTTKHLVADLRFMEDLRPQMIGIGPFVPHHATPFASQPAGSVETTLRLISILRLMHPQANIPATTSLGTIAGNGRLLGVMAGANVVMPNLSPIRVREKYALYDGKIGTGLEAAESRRQLEEAFAGIGYEMI